MTRKRMRYLAPFVLLVSIWFIFSHHDSLFSIETSNSSASKAGFPEQDLPDVVENSTLGFGCIMVLNLPHRTDRRDTMSLAAAYTDLDFSYVSGVEGIEVSNVTVPLDQGQTPPKVSSKGSWRGHLNAIRTVIENSLSTALILEDDLDWDVRIKEQMLNFSLASRTLTQPLLHPHPHKLLYADPSFPTPLPQYGKTDVSLLTRPQTKKPEHSPYGDNWDILWLGHCGVSAPFGNVPLHSKGRVYNSDSSVPQRKHIVNEHAPPQAMMQFTKYPDHTRVYHHAFKPVCSLAYAVSQRGARRILYELGVNKYTSEFDNMLRELCDGEREGVKLTCLTVQPGLWSHWRPRGQTKKESDHAELGEWGEEWREKGRSWNVRHGVIGNLVALSKSKDLVDQWPD